MDMYELGLLFFTEEQERKEKQEEENNGERQKGPSRRGRESGCPSR